MTLIPFCHQKRESRLLRDLLSSCDLCRSESTKTQTHNPNIHKCTSIRSDRFLAEGNACQARPCFPSVTCSELPNGSFKCGACPKGFTGDGVACKQWTTCLDQPCFRGSACIDDADRGFRCGPCPSGFTGDGVTCRPTVSCSNNPCSPGVMCVESSDAPGYRCGACPRGMTGDGTSCQDIDECQEVRPCHPQAVCVNLNPGYKCGPCPAGYTGKAIQGAGLEFARSNKQVCRDVNECDSSLSTACVPNSECINTPGSFLCGACIEGFVGNQTVGCHPHPGTCPDGTICDGNAECFMRRGFHRYQCRVGDFF